jgi:virginiamycin B lyase
VPARKKRNSNLFLALIVIILIVIVGVMSADYFLTRNSSTSSISSSQFVSIPEVSKYATEFPTQASTTSPNSVAVDANGNVWFALWNLSVIAQLIPSNGTIHEYHVPGLQPGRMNTWGMAVDNSRQLVWFTELATNSVWSFNITSGKFTQFKLNTPNAYPFYLAIDKDHNVWFTEEFGTKIGEVAANGSVIEITVPQGGSPEPSGIAIDSSGKVWFTLAGTDSIGSYYEGNFTIRNFTGTISTPVGIAADSHGNIWFTQHGPSFISEWNPTTNYFQTFSTSNNSLINSLPYFIWVDSNDNVWFNEHQGNAMSEFQPVTGTLLEYFIPSGVPAEGNISYALTSAISSTGKPWYTELFTGKVGTVNISEPLDVTLRVDNYSQSASLVAGKALSLGLSVSSQSQEVKLNAYFGNFTDQGNLTFKFSPSSGTGDFNSVVTIQTTGVLPGVYFVTITARTNSLAVSKVVEITVTG